MYYDSLQTLRGIFALIIFFHHFSFMRDGNCMLAAGGDLGVAFFFILSGFVLSQGYMRKERQGELHDNLSRFVAKRLSKIYPLHVLCLLLAILLRLRITPQDLANLFLLQAWVPAEDWYFSGNAVGWCLSDFLFFYAVFPWLCRHISRDRTGFLRVYGLIVICYVLIIIPFIPSRLQDPIIYINPLTRLLDFIFGIVLWEYVVKNRRIRPGKTPVAFGILTFILLGASIMVWYRCPSPYNLSVMWWPALAALLIWSVTGGERWLSIKPLVAFGDVSFSFYLIHVLSIECLDIVFDKCGLNLSPFLRLSLILLITIVLASIIHKYFVIPVEKNIRKLLSA